MVYTSALSVESWKKGACVGASWYQEISIYCEDGLRSGITSSRVVAVVVDYDYDYSNDRVSTAEGEKYGGDHGPDYVRQRGPEIDPE